MRRGGSSRGLRVVVRGPSPRQPVEASRFARRSSRRRSGRHCGCIALRIRQGCCFNIETPVTQLSQNPPNKSWTLGPKSGPLATDERVVRMWCTIAMPRCATATVPMTSPTSQAPISTTHDPNSAPATLHSSPCRVRRAPSPLLSRSHYLRFSSSLSTTKMTRCRPASYSAPLAFQCSILRHVLSTPAPSFADIVTIFKLSS